MSAIKVYVKELYGTARDFHNDRLNDGIDGLRTFKDTISAQKYIKSLGASSAFFTQMSRTSAETILEPQKCSSLHPNLLSSLRIQIFCPNTTILYEINRRKKKML
jgi:hypothetical protein